MTTDNDRQPLHIAIRKTDLEQIDLLADELDTSRNAIIRMALIEYIQKHKH